MDLETFNFRFVFMVLKGSVLDVTDGHRNQVLSLNEHFSLKPE